MHKRKVKVKMSGGAYGMKSLEYSFSCLMLSLLGSTEMNRGFTWGREDVGFGQGSG